MSPEQQELHDRLITVAHALITAPFVAYCLIILVVGIAYVAITERNSR